MICLSDSCPWLEIEQVQFSVILHRKVYYYILRPRRKDFVFVELCNSELFRQFSLSKPYQLHNLNDSTNKNTTNIPERLVQFMNNGFMKYVVLLILLHYYYPNFTNCQRPHHSKVRENIQFIIIVDPRPHILAVVKFIQDLSYQHECFGSNQIRDCES